MVVGLTSPFFASRYYYAILGREATRSCLSKNHTIYGKVHKSRVWVCNGQVDIVCVCLCVYIYKIGKYLLYLHYSHICKEWRGYLTIYIHV